MSLRGLLILAALLIVAVLGLVWTDRRERERANGEEETRLLSFEPREVRSIEIEARGRSIRLDRPETGGWVVARPMVFEADSRRVQELLDTLAGLRVARTVEETAREMGSFGLDPPEIVATVALGDRTEPLRLLVGRASPVGYQRYVALGGSRRVVLVDGSIVTALDRPADSFHEMRLFPLEAETIRRLVIDGAKGRFALERSGGDWRITEPETDRGDLERCDRLARAVASLRFTWVSSAAQQARRRRMRIEVEGNGAPATRVAWIEESAADGARAAGREPGGPYGVVDDALVRDIEVGVADLRDRDLASFSTPDAREIGWTIDGRSVELRRAAEGAPWIEGAGETSRSADANRVESLLNAVRWLKASDYEPRGSLGPETGRLHVTGSTGPIVRLSWGSIGESDRRWVRSSQREGLTAVASASAVDDIARRASEAAP